LKEFLEAGKRRIACQSLLPSFHKVLRPYLIGFVVAHEIEGQTFGNCPDGLALKRLNGADLRFADLEGADLEGANLSGANLIGANLRDANLGMAAMTNVILCNTTMPDGSVIYSGC